MRLALLVLLVLLSTNLQAGMVVRDSAGNSISLHETACVAATWLKDWKAATMVYQGKQYAACWKLQGGGVVVLDSSGDVTVIPPQAFRNEIGA